MTGDAARALAIRLFVLAAALAAVGALTTWGAGALGAPPVGPAAWARWAEGRGPVVAAAAVVRVVALAAGWYAAALAALSVVAAARPAAPLVAALRHAALPPLRPLLAAGLAIGPASPAATGMSAHDPGTAVAVAEAGANNEADDHAPAPGRGATMHLLDDAHATDDGPGVATPAPPPHEPPRHEPATHVIVAGEHLWAVAEQAMARALGREPTDAEVVPYWRELVERNRPRLADPSNPDLVFPGQVVDLPARPPGPSATR